MHRYFTNLLFNSKNIFLLFFIFLFANSCIEKIEGIDLKQEPYLVANCLFMPDSLFTVYVFSNSNMLDTNLRVVANATVEIWSENKLLETLPYDSNGFYKAPNLKPEINTQYTLKVRAKGYPSIEATDKIPDNTVEIIKANCVVDISPSVEQYPPSLDYCDSEAEILFAENNSETENYYQVAIFAQDTISLSLKYFTFLGETESPILTKYLDAPLFRSTFFSNQQATGDTIGFKILVYNTNLMFGDYPNTNNFFADLRMVSTNYFNYQVSLANYIYYQSNINIVNIDGNLFFDTEIKEVFSNIKNGYGIFAGYNATIIDLEEESYEL